MKSWCISRPSARFVVKMEAVLDVYQRPYDPQRPVVCLDETSKQLHSTPYGTLPMQSSQPQREDYEYSRHGRCNLFLAVEPLRGWRRVQVTDRRTSLDFAEQWRSLVDEAYPEAHTIVLVTDNLNTHSPACLYERFDATEAHRIATRLEWHYTPEHGSWLNMAECELSVLARQGLNRRIEDKVTLMRETTAWQDRRNQAHSIIDWRFTTTDARLKLKRLYPIVKERNLG